MRIRSQVSLPLGVAFALVATLALAGGVFAAETTLTADLAGVLEGENPGNPDGSGSATITLDPETGEVCWDMTADGIGAVTQSHIHTGAEGVSGPVLIPLDVDGFDGTTEGCTSDVAEADIQSVLDNPAGFYVNLHTADFPAGAIRGQLEGSTSPNTALPAPAGFPLAALGVLLLALGAAIGLRSWRPIATRD
ncbi:MAG TPA: CHRD domain-containing protein [Candidatus Limnocylindria bacterium]|nr:CHRD domain-containing protein [Candidatus Limnocylindria bacterium]